MPYLHSKNNSKRITFFCAVIPKRQFTTSFSNIPCQSGAINRCRIFRLTLTPKYDGHMLWKVKSLKIVNKPIQGLNFSKHRNPSKVKEKELNFLKWNTKSSENKIHKKWHTKTSKENAEKNTGDLTYRVVLSVLDSNFLDSWFWNSCWLLWSLSTS